MRRVWRSVSIDRMARRLALTLALSALLAAAFAASASAYSAGNPTSSGNPLAGQHWFIDWQEGMSQQQYLQYVQAGGKSLSEILFGPDPVIDPPPPPFPDEPDPMYPEEFAYRTDSGQSVWTALQQTDNANLLAHVPEKLKAKAKLIHKIARNPQTKRVTDSVPDPRYALQAYFERLEAAWPGALGFVYAYGLPHKFKDASTRTGGICGNFDPGAKGDAAYRKWVDGLVAGISGHRAIVFLEPDGIISMKCLSRRAKAARLEMLREAIAKLGKLAGVTVYLDAGHSGFMAKGRTINEKASWLKEAGVNEARGFFLNSTGYNRTKKEVAHGDKLVGLLGGKPHFIVSTAVNGNGPYVLKRKLKYANEQRCNPPGRALGEEPTVRTSSKNADAYFFIGDPGRSGANCPHKGMPRSPGGGKWWEWYALMLARNASWK